MEATKPELQPAAEPQVTVWHPATRVAFRFFFTYFVLYVLPYPVAGVPATNWPANFYTNFWHRLVPWVAANVFHFHTPITVFTNTSGDTTYDYAAVLCLLILSVIVTAIWSWLDRDRLEYRRLHAWLRLFLRFVVVTALVPYGANKIFQAQFPAPRLEKLMETYGQSSPMGLLWASMGASRLYSFFGGVAEVLGGVLLIVPRLTLLGALISFAALSNVLMLNLGYDVTVKIYTFHLVLMCVFLMAPDLKRLADFFVLQKPVLPAREEPLFARREFNRGALIMQVILGLTLTLVSMSKSAQFVDRMDADQAPPALRGVWMVEDMVMDGQNRPPLITDSERWQSLIFDHAKGVVAMQMNGEQVQYGFQVDPMERTLRLASDGANGWNGVFSTQDPRPGELILTGELDGHRMQVKLRRLDLSDPSRFLLMNRGFHWVNEQPLRR